MLKLNLVLLATLFLSACSPPTPAPTSQGMGKLMISNAQDGSLFAIVVPQTLLEFPLDHQAHDDYRIEWWYLTANLETQQGEPLGLQWTQFRVALAPPDTAADQSPAANDWATRQLYLAHSAVTTKQQHFAAERWSRGQAHLAGVETNPLAIYLDDWRWQSRTQDLFPAVLSGGDEAFSYRLKLGSRAPYQRQGEQGFSIKSADGSVASHYYSQPFIHIKGEVRIGTQIIPVVGQGWLDREWSSQFLTTHQQGWDWFALRLDHDTALMLFQLRSDADSEPHFYAGRLMHRDGSGRSLSADDIIMQAITSHDIQGKRLPTQWQISVPTEQIEIQVTALNPEALMPLSIPYWEGPVTIEGSHQGVGYMELTGY
ncbi:lipocalin-like domain-containing protein [Shewanella sp. NIFS-20-20]|uniref:lipocalin-like domain-containing protein n=1 Tax=Shewanella sp. NIFS-20-20 TaxID=2853806 RepID=UPI001C44EB99|nr:lipocalin-like domain-containing protein [Shewanella sp. NIFS-20-20]MBV7314099.1 carotenoid 1,2-hydratase [Shewanella sp. NIFS-20-20]